MVEMTEVANILRNATPASLLILDEIGRGTSTFDGLAIAWAVIEYISNPKILGAKTLFATHYHELTELEGSLPGVKNYCIAVKEKGDDIVFLRKIIPGGADQSYGIEVAKLAGVPNPVIARAREILAQLESQGAVAPVGTVSAPAQEQMTLGDLAGGEVLDTLRNTAVDTLTPIEALNLLYQLKQKLS
jgi:DNA mismatch repair protein MutS